MKLNSFKFQDGKVFWLPEYPEKRYHLFMMNKGRKCPICLEYKQAIAKSLASAIEVAPGDLIKVSNLIWLAQLSEVKISDVRGFPDFIDWQPENGKVYSVECEMEVKAIDIPLGLWHHLVGVSVRHQVARLKPKDKVKSEKIAGRWRVKSSTSPIADTGDYFTQLWLTNGIVNLHSEKDDNETELQLIADQLNKDEIPAANSHDMKESH